MSSPDFTPKEADFQTEIRASLDSHRAIAGACPRPELLMAAVSAVAFEGADEVLRHLKACTLCQELSRDLAEYEFPGANPEEDRRIRARLGRTEARRISWRNWWLPALAAAAVVLAVGILVKWRPGLAPEEISRPDQSPDAAAANVVPVAPAVIRIPAEGVLSFRGNTTTAGKYMSDLAAALEPYRRGDYLGAARALDALSKKHPNAVEPSFYLGVCQLLLNQNHAAVTSLEDARRRGAGALQDDISWYLTAAYRRVGNTADARREAAGLCARAGEYRDRACGALAAMGAK